MNTLINCEVSGRHTSFYFTNPNSRCPAKAVYEYEEMFSATGFALIRKSFPANMLHLKEYIRGKGSSVILSNKTEVEVSRRKKGHFLSRMKSFFNYY
ncbi:MAG: LytTR family transcriptional regulator DNA-binding domain-containing protein [Chitinophagales bacterium]|nr:LytTR family transcriptional regulator DNA-binding domain-containing protein [Chitinophagales bacterium]